MASVFVPCENLQRVDHGHSATRLARPRPRPRAAKPPELGRSRELAIEREGLRKWTSIYLQDCDTRDTELETAW
jgi:hypothetical protein